MSEHLPGEPAPHTGNYEELNIFGAPTGIVVHAQRGHSLPPAPLSFTWLFAERAPDPGLLRQGGRALRAPEVGVVASPQAPGGASEGEALLEYF